MAAIVLFLGVQDYDIWMFIKNKILLSKGGVNCFERCDVYVVLHVLMWV